TGSPTAIQIDTKNRLWFSDGRSTRQWNGSRLQRHRNLRGVLELEDKSGNLWFTEGRGMHQYDPNLNEIPSTVNSGLGNDEVRTIFEAVDGKLWFGHNNGVTVFDPTPAVSTHAGLGTKRIRTMYEDSRGYLWLSVPGSVTRYNTKTDESFTDPLRLDRAQNVAISGAQDIHSGRSQSEIVKIFEVGGDIWFINAPESHFGATQYTFFRYANASFDHQISISIRTKTGPGGERSDSNTDVLVTEGEHVWLAFGGHLFKADVTGLLWLTERGSQRILFQKATEMHRGTRVQAIEPGAVAITDLYRDTKDRLWVHFGNGNVKRYPQNIDRAASTTRPIAPDVLNLKATTLLKTTPTGKWFFNAVTGRLIRWNNIETGEPVVLDGESTSAPLAVWQNPTEGNEEVTFIFSDALKTYRGTVLEETQTINELGTANASLTSQEGILWLATSRGAVRYDGINLTTYTTKEDGFLVDNVRDVIEDSRGNIWFATRGGGTVRYDGEIFHNRTTKNGWAHNNISKILESSDKDIWFATERGVTQYTPTRGGLPECRITTLEADKPYTDLSSNLVLSARGAKIFNVRGISPLREGLSYEFKLIGLDTPAWTTLSTEEFALLPTGSGIPSDQWVPLSAPGLANQQAMDNSGVTQAFQNQNGILRIRYTGLKAGNYSFLIKAFRIDWAYTAPPAAVDFSIPPPIWTRWRTYLPTLIFITVVFSLIGRLIVNRRHTLQLRNAMRQQEEAEMQRIRAELSEAQNIQMGLLPTAAPDTKAFDIAGMSVPATQVGGDFYDYLTVENGQTAIAVADAAGKGLRGAMNAVLTNGMLYEVSRFKSEAAVILRDLNIGLAPRMYGPSFIALNLAILDETEQRIDYANGGQPYPILKSGADIIEIESGDLPLGSMKRVEYESTTFDLSEGDFLIFHTDGLIEALNVETEMYGTERLKETVSRIPDAASAAEAVQHLVDDVHKFVGEAEQYDDLTIVVIKRRSDA
ncbi:MAG: SpoIIE family protein phosphatase, partial [Candidatus Poribacteria bacterium]|nr:SpoIIE family protein phosphatase [Candidatus Poribacteria bacterium]